MKITYVSPNRSHHVQYAQAMNDLGILNYFITGASRFSPRSSIEASLGDRLIRYDLVQSIYQASSHLGLPSFTNYLENKATEYLSSKCLRYIYNCNIFLYYRTIGMRTALQIKARGLKVLCIMEEVNSHILNYNEILTKECIDLGLDPSYILPLDSSLRLAAYDQADLILCPSSFVYNSFLERGFSRNKLVKNIFGINRLTRKYSPSFPSSFSSSHPFRLLYVGQLHLRKGLRYAIEAFRKLDLKNKEFLIVGPSTPYNGLKDLNIPNDVRFLGTLKGNALHDIYKSASAFILPSLEEGLALVLTEALSYGLPVIATRSSGAEDLISDGKSGILVNPGSSSELLSAMQFLAESSETCRFISENALNSKFLDWNSSTTLLYKSLANHLYL